MKKIGFVLSAPPNYSETFLIQEFELFHQLGFEILLFEGYSQGKNKTNFKTIKSLPTSVNSISDLSHIITTLSQLFTVRLHACASFVKNEYQSNSSFIRILKRIWFNAHILNYKVDFLHFCFADVAIQKELVAKSIGAKMSVSMRGSDILIYPKGKEDCYKRLWKNVDKVHAVSNWVYKNAIDLGLDQKKSHQIIHDFVNTNSIDFNNSDIKWPLRIITVGRLVPIKDHEFAINVIHYLKQQGLDVQLIIVGDGPLKEALQNKIIKNDLSNSIQLYGKVNHKKVLELMNTCDLYMHTSKSEGFNVSILEAQASGLLTISLEVGSTKENIEDGKSGWIIPNRNYKLLGEKIMELVNLDSTDRLKIKSYARKRMKDNFDIEIKRLQWKKFFNT